MTTKRINRGGGHSYLLDGEPCDAVTWIRDNGIPKPGLINHAGDATAGYAIDHWEELHEMTPSQRLKILSKARFQSLKRGGVRGKAVHTYAQQLAAGVEVDVPEEYDGYVQAYLRFAEEWELEEFLVETAVFNRRHRYGGTIDVFGRLCDEKNWILDYKTAPSGIWPETAIQIAAYANSEFYLDADGNEHPMPQIDAAGGIWLRADGSYELVPVDFGPETFRVFLYAQQVAHFAQLPREATVGEALTPPTREEAKT